MADRLSSILDAKRAHVAARKAVMPAEKLQADACGPTRGFARALEARRAAGEFGLIAEIKKASQSKGLIRADFQPAAIAAAYAGAGAACLSVLTDEPYFQGRDSYLAAARDAAALPVLRKDFIVDRYQLAESRALGADAILLIVAALPGALLAELAAEALELGLDILVEVHDEAELARALELPARLIGINNRDLKTMAVDLATTERLAALVPGERLVIAESGLTSHADLVRMEAAGVTSFLVGEALMRETDVAAATRRLLTGT